MIPFFSRPWRGVLLFALVLVAVGPAYAHDICGTPPADAPRNFSFGQPGDFAELTRTVRVTMGDMRFEPAAVSAKTGESIRFVITNPTATDHDFTLGDAAAQRLHRREMAAMSDIAAEHAHHRHHFNAIYVPAGQTRVLIWTFSHPGDFEFDCNMPGHYEAGMSGRISVR